MISNDGAARLPLEAIVATAASNLADTQHLNFALILANGRIHVSQWDHDNWNGGQDTWIFRVTINRDALAEISNRKAAEEEIANALNDALRSVSGSDFAAVELVQELADPTNWRDTVNARARGEGINNQGRVRSDAIATLTEDGLRFRSRAEINVYQVLKKTGIPFAPLSVVLRGGRDYRRIEPDFIIFMNQLTAVIEVDGDLWHRETPAGAHERLELLHARGVVVERVDAKRCASLVLAEKAIAEVVDRLGNRRPY